MANLPKLQRNMPQVRNRYDYYTILLNSGTGIHEIIGLSHVFL